MKTFSAAGRLSTSSLPSETWIVCRSHRSSTAWNTGSPSELPWRGTWMPTVHRGLHWTTLSEEVGPGKGSFCRTSLPCEIHILSKVILLLGKCDLKYKCHPPTASQSHSHFLLRKLVHGGFWRLFFQYPRKHKPSWTPDVVTSLVYFCSFL